MLGLQFIKMPPHEYVIQYRNGQLVREGTGLSFFYFAPTSSLVRISLASVDIPFIFKEITSDYQEITIQGQITYRVADAHKLSTLMKFSLKGNGKEYESEDPDKLPQRLINHTRVLARSLLSSMHLKDALNSTDEIVNTLDAILKEAETVRSLGIEILGLSILAIKPTTETARALEADAREKILLEADEAVYIRRNAAVEQERAIKENELNTEIAVENKKRQINETKMEAKKSIQNKERELKEAEMATRITLEKRKEELIKFSTQNSKLTADAKAYDISSMMNAISSTDPKIIQSLTTAGMEPSRLVALAFKEIAEGAERINQLNMSPDLLRELMASDKVN